LSSEISGRKYGLTDPHKTLVILKPNGVCGDMLFSIKPAQAQSEKQQIFLVTELWFLSHLFKAGYNITQI
jgi:hypothetical protein